MFLVSLTARGDARRIPQSGLRRFVRPGSDAGGAYALWPRKFPRDDETRIRSWLSRLPRLPPWPEEYLDQGIQSSTFRLRFQKILTDICMRTCAAVTNRPNSDNESSASERPTQRSLPESPSL